MKKFKCIVTRTDEYEIEFDETKINEKWMKDFRESMYPYKTLKEHAENLAQLRARFGSDFYEGYGYVKENGEKPLFLKDSRLEEGININVISEDDDCDIDLEEI